MKKGTNINMKNQINYDKKELINYLNSIKKINEETRLGKVFSTDKNGYFYDVGTGKIIQCSQVAFRILDMYFNNKNYFIENSEEDNELWEIVIKENLLQSLKPRMLYENCFYEGLQEKINNSLEQIILEVTGRCNLRCKYCIYNETYEENRNFNCEDMSEEIALKAIDYLADCGGTDVTLAFYGGEPLIKYDLIVKCIDYAKKKICDKKLNFAFTTNGVLMDEEKAKYFASLENVNILVSLDGPKNHHDKCRVDIEGKGSFERALKGLHNLVEAFGKKAGKHIAINGVMTPPYNLEKVEEIYNFFYNLEWLPNTINIQFETVRSGSYKTTELDYNLQKNQNDSGINPMWLWAKKRYENNTVPAIDDKKAGLFMSDIRKQLYHIHSRYIYDIALENYPFNACCIPAARRLYVNTKGDLYLCERIENSPKIGNIFQGIDINTIKKEYVKNFSDKSIADCQKCWALRLCRVCYAECYNETGLCMIEKSKKCELVRKSLEADLKIYHTVLERSPKQILELNKLMTE